MLWRIKAHGLKVLLFKSKQPEFPAIFKKALLLFLSLEERTLILLKCLIKKGKGFMEKTFVLIETF